ncbi:MAG TPA: serine/threonine-protein kinase [Gemmataceae bacterium]|nr:serine/threonine-protein kinase [Gemmataceae bacterium]
MSSEQQISEMVQRWERLRAQGQTFAAEELCRDTPELLSEVQQRIKALRARDPVAQASTEVRPSETGDSYATSSVALPVTSVDFLAPAQQPDEIGRLGPYRVLRLLGEGGMGMVFQAEDPQLQRQVALKIMRPGTGTPAARQRFLREARSAAALEDEHIVPIYHVGEDRGVPFLAMQLLKGESLHERLRREGSLPFAEVIRIGQEIARGLAAAHERGVIHRDIKPSNLWLHERPGGPAGARRVQAKVLDFGLARSVAEDGQLTQSGSCLGTPAFMSPEQADGLALDARSDLFSLGCVLYAMTTGQQPFQGNTLTAVLRAVVDHHPRSPRELRPEIPPGLSDLIMQLLNKDREARPASAREVAETLRQLETASPAAVPTVARPVARPAGRSRRSRVLLLAGAGTAIVLSLVLWQHRASSPSLQEEPKANGVETLAPLWVPKFRVSVIKERAREYRSYELGTDIFAGQFDDLVQLKAEFSEPAYCFLLAFNPDGKDQLCWPADSHQPPQRQDRLIYPPKADSFFSLNDGVGLQAFVLLAARQPLPSYGQWKAERPLLVWEKLPAQAGMVWRGDGKRLEPVMRGSGERGAIVEVEGIPVLAKLCEQLRHAPGIDALAVEAFAVLPAKGEQ